MPRKSKKEKKEPKHKTKNIIQQVIVKLDGEGKRITKRRKRTARRKPKHEINVMATAPPTVVYQTGAYPSPPAPPAFAPVAAPVATPVPFSVAKPKPILEDIGTHISEPIEVPTKKEQLEIMFEPVVAAVPTVSEKKPVKLIINKRKEEPVFGIGPDELPTTASFADPNILEKLHTPDRVYTEEPDNFKSPVYGNHKFDDLLQPTELIEAGHEFITNDPKLIESERRIKQQIEKKQKLKKQIELIESPILGNINDISITELRKMYSDKFGLGSWRNPETGKAIPAKELRQKLKSEYNL